MGSLLRHDIHDPAFVSTGSPIHHHSSEEENTGDLILPYTLGPFQTWTPLHFLILSCACAIFTDGNNVPLLSTLYMTWCMCFMFGIHKTRTLIGGVLALVLCRSIGVADIFQDEDISLLVSYLITTVFVLVITIPITAAMVWQKRLWIKYNNNNNHNISWYIPLVFPLLLTGYYQLISEYSFIGSSCSPGMELSLESSIRQTVALLGEMGVTFWVGWLTSVSAGVIVGRISVQSRHVYCFGGVTVAVLVFGSIYRNLDTGFGLVNIHNWPLTTTSATVSSSSYHKNSPAVLQATCLTYAKESNSNAIMLNRTNERLAKGDDLIVWSETSGRGRIDGATDLEWNPSNPGAVVAVAFEQNISDTNNEESYNSVEFWQAGKSLGRYDKRKPVPIIEPKVKAGDTPPTVHSITFTPSQQQQQGGGGGGGGNYDGNRSNVTLKVSAAICFDFDFPGMIRSGAHTADLVIGPSEYWASIGRIFWGHNTLRAMENGFTLYKCAMNGFSGAVDPYGFPLATMTTTSDAMYTTQFAVQKGIPTIYADYGGWLFGWVCLALSLLHFLHVGIIRYYQQQQGRFIPTTTNNGAEPNSYSYLDRNGSEDDDRQRDIASGVQLLLSEESPYQGAGVPVDGVT